eukprot:5065507-Heterocapsa_arctica.AAC.1
MHSRSEEPGLAGQLARHSRGQGVRGQGVLDGAPHAANAGRLRLECNRGGAHVEDDAKDRGLSGRLEGLRCLSPRAQKGVEVGEAGERRGSCGLRLDAHVVVHVVAAEHRQEAPRQGQQGVGNSSVAPNGALSAEQQHSVLPQRRPEVGQQDEVGSGHLEQGPLA